MHPVDVHIQAVNFANEQVMEMYSVRGPYEPGTVVHAYWLQEYDYKHRILSKLVQV